MNKVFDSNKGSLRQWAISLTGLQCDTKGVSAAINSYCQSNNCIPVHVSIAYNSKSLGGAIECVAIVQKTN